MSNEARKKLTAYLILGTEVRKQMDEKERQSTPGYVSSDDKATFGSSNMAIRSYERMRKNEQTMHAPIFRKACELANVEPTRRQASKWNNGYGAAWKQRGEARRQLIDQNLDEGIRKGPHVVEMLNAKLEDQS